MLDISKEQTALVIEVYKRLSAGETVYVNPATRMIEFVSDKKQFPAGVFHYFVDSDEFKGRIRVSDTAAQ